MCYYYTVVFVHLLLQYRHAKSVSRNVKTLVPTRSNNGFRCPACPPVNTTLLRYVCFISFFHF